jgi:uncharacterized phage infection (PIP) family protein YhgE
VSLAPLELAPRLTDACLALSEPSLSDGRRRRRRFPRPTSLPLASASSAAVKSTDEEIAALKEDNQKLNREVAELRAFVKKNDLSQVASLKSRVEALEQRLKVAEEQLQTKAEVQEVAPIKAQAAAAAETATRTQTDLMAFQTEQSKWSKGMESRVNSLQTSLTDQIAQLSDQKANKADVDSLTKRVDSLTSSGSKLRDDMEALRQLIEEFVATVDAKIAHKADVELLNDKMGRLETDDLLNQITNQLTDKLRRTGKEMQELREDLDVILTMIMQDANVGAVSRCVACV